jgi:hypothetical protein
LPLACHLRQVALSPRLLARLVAHLRVNGLWLATRAGEPLLDPSPAFQARLAVVPGRAVELTQGIEVVITDHRPVQALLRTQNEGWGKELHSPPPVRSR